MAQSIDNRVSELHGALDAHVRALEVRGSAIKEGLLPGRDPAELQKVFEHYRISVHDDVIGLYAWSACQARPWDNPALFHEVDFWPLEETIESLYIPDHCDNPGEDPDLRLEFPVFWFQGRSNVMRISMRPGEEGSIWMGYGDPAYGDGRWRCFDSLAQAVRVATWGLEVGLYWVDPVYGGVECMRTGIPDRRDLEFPPFGDWPERPRAIAPP